MQMTTDARAWLDATVRRILARHPLGDAERAGITYELMSHLHAAGEARAKAAGRALVTPEDLQAGLSESGGEAGLAEAFVQPLAKPIERASLGRRAGAYLIDMGLVLIGIILVHQTLDTLVLMFAGVESAPPPQDARASLWLPWGFHDPTMPLLWQGVFTVASAATLLGYFVWTEARMGRTLGKRALDLRVMRVDGAPVTLTEALVRNVAKVSPILFLLDVVSLLILHKEKQRVSDKMAGTVVVKA